MTSKEQTPKSIDEEEFLRAIKSLGENEDAQEDFWGFG